MYADAIASSWSGKRTAFTMRWIAILLTLTSRCHVLVREVPSLRYNNLGISFYDETKRFEFLQHCSMSYSDVALIHVDACHLCANNDQYFIMYRYNESWKWLYVCVLWVPCVGRALFTTRWALTRWASRTYRRNLALSDRYIPRCTEHCDLRQSFDTPSDESCIAALPIAVRVPPALSSFPFLKKFSSKHLNYDRQFHYHLWKFKCVV